MIAHTSRKVEKTFPSPKTERDQDRESLGKRENEIEGRERPKREKIPSGRKNKPLAGRKKREKKEKGEGGKAKATNWVQAHMVTSLSQGKKKGRGIIKKREKG